MAKSDDTSAARRLDAPSFHRNHQPIREVLVRHLAEPAGHVLEIGSGTGQHAVAFARAFPAVRWWPTDPDPAYRASIEAWRAHEALPNLAPPVALDAADDDWSPQHAGVPPGESLTALMCINVLHIAPWQVTEGLMRGAGRHLGARGRLFVYGPFIRQDVPTAQSNLQFDASLRARDAAWGIRDLADVEAQAREHELVCAEVAEMPANNLTLVFARGGPGA